MMTTVLTPVKVENLSRIEEMMDEMFAPGAYEFCGNNIVLSYDEEKMGELYNIWSKLDYIQFVLGMEGVEIDFHNGPSVLAGMLEAFEIENGLN